MARRVAAAAVAALLAATAALALPKDAAFALDEAPAAVAVPAPAALRNASYAERASWYLDQSARLGGRDIHADLARLRTGIGSITDAYKDAIERMDNRVDGADFYLPGLARMVFQFGSSPLLPPAVCTEIIDALQRMQYWVDEGGEHGNLQYWSENHAVLYHASEYVIGGLMPTAVFTNSNMTGAQHAEKGRALLARWLDLRSRIGFSEYCSETYNTFVIAALSAVADLGMDEEMRTRAAMMLDLLLLDLSMNSFRGVVTGYRGRSYEDNKISDDRQSTSPVLWLLTGEGSTALASRGAIPLVVSQAYVPPVAIQALASDRTSTWTATGRTGIDTSEGPQYGLGFTDPADGIVWFGLGGYAAPDTIELFFIVPTAYDLWDHEVWAPLQPLQPLAGTGFLPQFAETVWPLTTGALLGPVSTAVYRTAHGALGTAVQNRPTTAGFQQHVWQATLSEEAIVFVTHPGPNPSDYALSAWTGGATVPRAALSGPVLVALYQPPAPAPLGLLYPPRTHAYFPRDKFDEVVQRDGWTFGRVGDGYLGLYSARPTAWTTEGEYADRELVADGGAQTVWIAEIGSIETDPGGFAAFTSRLANGTVNATWTEPAFEGGGDGLLGCIVRSGCFDPADPVGSLVDCVVPVPVLNPNPPCEDYLDIGGLAACAAACEEGDRLCRAQCVREAVVLDPPVAVPGRMEVRFTDAAGRVVTYGWDAPLTVTAPGQAPVVVEPETYRYRNPYVTAPWGARTFNITAGMRSLLLDFDAPSRVEV